MGLTRSSFIRLFRAFLLDGLAKACELASGPDVPRMPEAVVTTRRERGHISEVGRVIGVVRPVYEYRHPHVLAAFMALPSAEELAEACRSTPEIREHVDTACAGPLRVSDPGEEFVHLHGLDAVGRLDRAIALGQVHDAAAETLACELWRYVMRQTVELEGQTYIGNLRLPRSEIRLDPTAILREVTDEERSFVVNTGRTHSTPDCIYSAPLSHVAIARARVRKATESGHYAVAPGNQLEQRSQAVARLLRATKHGGILVYCTTRSVKPWVPQHSHGYSTLEPIPRYADELSLSARECDALPARWQQWRSRLQEPPGVLDVAMEYIESSTRRLLPHHCIMDLGIALEALLLPTTEAELGHRLAFRVAHVLGASLSERRALYQETRDLYALRSAIAHGGLSSKDARPKTKRLKHRTVAEWRDRLALLIRRVVALHLGGKLAANAKDLDDQLTEIVLRPGFPSRVSVSTGRIRK